MHGAYKEVGLQSKFSLSDKLCVNFDFWRSRNFVALAVGVPVCLAFQKLHRRRRFTFSLQNWKKEGFFVVRADVGHCGRGRLIQSVLASTPNWPTARYRTNCRFWNFAHLSNSKSIAFQTFFFGGNFFCTRKKTAGEPCWKIACLGWWKVWFSSFCSIHIFAIALFLWIFISNWSLNGKWLLWLLKNMYSAVIQSMSYVALADTFYKFSNAPCYTVTQIS